MGSRKVKSRSSKVSIEKKKKIGKKKWFNHKCIAQVSLADFAFSHNDRSFSQSVQRDDRKIPRSHKEENTRKVVQAMVQARRISSKILIQTMKCMAQQQGQGFAIGVVPPPWSKVLDSEMCIDETNEKILASFRVPNELVNYLMKELKTRFFVYPDPALHVDMVGGLKSEISFQIVGKPLPVERLTEEDVVARLVEEFGLPVVPPRLMVAAEDVLKDVAQKCVVAFQLLEAEAVVLEQML